MLIREGLVRLLERQKDPEGVRERRGRGEMLEAVGLKPLHSLQEISTPSGKGACQHPRCTRQCSSRSLGPEDLKGGRTRT